MSHINSKEVSMFRIGDFSKIAQVPASLLRYYNDIGLFVPAHCNRDTGYRYYSVQQLSQINRILALKDLGQRNKSSPNSNILSSII